MPLAMNDNSINETAYLQERIERAMRELAMLYDISSAMRTTLDLHHILYIILTGVTSHTGLGFNRAVLFLVNTKKRCLEPQMAIGPESGEHAQRIWAYIAKANSHLEDLIKEENVEQNTTDSALLNSIKSLQIPLEKENNSLLAKAYHEGKPVHITPEQIAKFDQDILFQRFRTNELVIMPLKAKDKVNGLIIADNLYTQKPIMPDDLRLFGMLANQAGLAIENAHLYEIVRYKSQTDSITGLWNHGFFQDQLSKEMETPENPDLPISLLMIDIDDFKKLNDTYGHRNGDIILKELAAILNESSRGNDYACRYGGEEFAMILTQTNKEQAMVISERIRDRIAQHTFCLPSVEAGLKVTVSIGVASYPPDAQTKEELITGADKAMYVAKFSGKNQSCAI